MKRFSLGLLIIINLLLIVFSCKEDDDVTHPKVETIEVKATSFSTIVAKGVISTKGSFKVIDYGFVYSFSGGNFSVDDGTKVSLGNQPSEGPIETEISLQYSQYGYYNGVNIRTYLTNEKGTVYGKVVNTNLPQAYFTSVDPLMGNAGNKITIQGLNLSSDKGAYEVRFNETVATVVEASADKIVVEVPANISQPYYYGGIRIYVKYAGNSTTVTENFRLTPTFIDFSPKEGSFGSVITVTGNNFNYQSLTARLGEENYSCTIVNNTTLTIAVPTNIKTESFKISIGNGSVYEELPGEFKMTAPRIESISPAVGISGSNITISGSNFNFPGYYSNGNTVKVGEYNAVIHNSSSTSITFQVPSELTSGTYPIEVFTGIYTVVSPNNLEVTTPVIRDFSPKSGGPGTLVTITGTNLKADNGYNSVFFGTTNAIVSEWTSSYIKVYTPGWMTHGAMKLTVTTGGQSLVSSDDFVLIPPSITSFSPTSGVAGELITINGEGFNSNGGYNTVYLGNTQAYVSQASSTSLTIKIPSNVSPGSVKISVTVDGVTGTSDQDFTIK